MSGSGRKRSSKWDLSDEPEFSPGRKQIRSGRFFGDVAGSNSSKWSYSEQNDTLKPVKGFSSKEPPSGGRGSNNAMNRDHRDLDATMEWDTDGGYSKKASPWLEEKQKRHSQSPENGWSRSVRSRSPHGFRRDSGVNDRNRMRIGGSTRPCRDFAAGKCRRGSNCNFHHLDNQNRDNSLEGKHREDGAPRFSATHEAAMGSRNHDNSWEGKHWEDGAPRSSATHESDRSNEACINFAKGRCRLGASCNFAHHDNSDGYGKVSMDELNREKEIDRRRRDSSFEQGSEHWPNRTSDTPCKFFANGNCRHGKHCRFSHDRQEYRSPNRRLRDDRWANNPDGNHQMLDRRKSSDSISPNRRQRDYRRGSGANVADADKVRDSPMQNDTVTVSDTAKLIEDKSGNVAATDAGFSTVPMRDGWRNWSDKSRVQGEPQFSNDKKEADCWLVGNTGANMHGSKSTGKDIWLGDAKMSPDWNYRMGSSSHVEEHGQNKHGISHGGTYLASSEHERIQVAPGQGFNQNAQNGNPLHTSSGYAVRESQVVVSILPSKDGGVDDTHNQEVSTEKKYTVEPIMDAELSQASSRNPPTQNVVSNEQLAQLSNLSASLAHILGAGQQLPELYAALNSHDLNETPPVEKTEAPAKTVSNTCNNPDPVGAGQQLPELYATLNSHDLNHTPPVEKTEEPAMNVSSTCINPDPVGLTKQYDPTSDTLDPKNVGRLLDVPSSKNIAGEEVEVPPQLSNVGQQDCGDSIKAASSEVAKSGNLIQLQPGQNTKVITDSNKVVAEERQNSQDDHKSTKGNGPPGNMNQNGGLDEAKTTKDTKGIRAFKFALVEFVKELLKPAWKEGQITKEDYKTIVKKVVDKVTGTMQGANIPQTQEKIDHYLSFSKPKLNKLVQAYVEKAQKG